MNVGNLHLVTLVVLLYSAVPLIKALTTICADIFNDLSFADPASCSSFYVCQRGKAIRRECSNGLYFDPKIQSCNLPGLIKCFNGDRGVTLLGPTQVNQTSVLPDGKAKDEVPVTTYCPPTTASPPKKIQKVHKEKAIIPTTPKSINIKKSKVPIRHNMDNEDDDNDNHEIIEVAQPPVERIDVLRSSRDCRGIEDGVYLTDPRHCRRFYMCRKNRARRHNCPANQWFDRETKACANRTEVSNCPANRN
ncbi:uncharacterized protein LOC108115194 [Drosophila eugracilis]|uniref:uncharacterized protein LOC108115194 n=1 Tax=Drosophila eugracilis TaxID=29029 RepID=UPI0007E7C2CD|nr:uncharacterized protein LOC108115194 [Drosophila eugracilis]